ncbi:hypothetical protein [Psychromonas sp.]|uniref:hypothetical protein n=1 Tax=Psychromonas sp. TaxID=1884585 RepID=UPI0035677959
MTPTITMFFTLTISAIIILLLIYFLMRPTLRNVITAPSILTGFGIFGTFLGITIGLMDFNANNIVGSVPIFLSGIKLAFWSSVVGILASLIHKLRFIVAPLEERYVADEMEINTVESLKSMTQSLNNIEKIHANDSKNPVINELGEFIHALGDKLEAGLSTALRGQQDYISAGEIKIDEAFLSALNNLKDELAKNSADEQHLVKAEIQGLVGELREDTTARSKQTESLLEALTALKESNQVEDGTVTFAVKELNKELAKNSAMQSENLLAALATLKDTNRAEDETLVAALRGVNEELVKNSAIQAESLLGALTDLKQSTLAENETLVAALRGVNEELVKNSAIQAESLLGALTDLKQSSLAENETVVATLQELKALNEAQAENFAMQTENLSGVLASLKESSRTGDAAVISALQELNEGLSKNSAIQAGSILDAFAGLKEDIGAGTEEERKVSREQMEALFSGLTRAATGTLGELSDIADNLIEQAKWQAVNLAKEISAASEMSAKSMLTMLKDILGATEDSNLKITAELAKLRSDVAADLKSTTEQSAALVEQLHAMTDSYKASLISTVADLKAQISKDMKANYNLIDTYTKAVADVTGANQSEALERMEGIANIMQNVVQSSADMSTLLHENAAAIGRMQDTFTGTNEGTLGRFLLNMNQDLIGHITALQNSLDAQGSLGTLMQDMNSETNTRLKELGKAFEGSIFEIKQLPQQFVKGMSKLEMMSDRNK